MTIDNLKEKTAQGLLWGGISNGIQQLLSLLFGIFLARLLTQADYGLVGVLTVFSATASALQEGGFISALNKKKEVTHRDYNAVFWCSTLISLCLYALLWLVAPLIANFYEEPILTPLSRYLFIGFVISSLNIAPRAYLFRNLKVKETSIITICSIIISGIIGVTMAANGYAFWGIATQTIAYVGSMTVLCYAFTHWHPTLPVDFTPIREMIGFSSKLIITNIFNIINNNLFSNILGKFYSMSVVGNFSQANKWNQMGHNLITNMLYGVAQPVFTKVEDDKERQLRVLRKMLRFTAFISFPAMFGLSIISKEVIVITITERWTESADILSLLCIWGAFVPLSSLFSNLIISRGHSSIYMWCTISLCLTLLVAVIAVSPLGFQWMLRFFIGINILWLFVWFWFVRREIGLRLRDMLLDISPYILLATILTFSAAYLFGGISNLYLSLLVKVVFVATLYPLILWLAGSHILKESLRYILKK